ncbi:MAG: TIGR00730 family Rossman fold protein [Pseudomonadales bacterium]
MNPFRIPGKIFRSAGEEASACDVKPDTAQTLSPTYELAFADKEFLLREELRPVRLQLELLKPDLVMNEHEIGSTIVVFGGARVHEREKALAQEQQAEAAFAQSPQDRELEKALQRARRAVEMSHYYEEARKFGNMITREQQMDAGCHLHIVTGGGPGIMEAANRGASEAGGESIGLNIMLPFEQCPNAYITPELCFQFHYFAIRKMHFLMRARALLACPGGFGTLDELFETLTLVQTGKIKRLPILLMGEKFWRELINFDQLVDYGLISVSDMRLFTFVENAEQALEQIKLFYEAEGEVCI